MRTSRLFADRGVVAVVEQGLPLDLLQVDTNGLVARLAFERGLASIDECERVPFTRVLCAMGDSRERGMLADAAEPVLRIPEIAFAAMHDSMPETAGGRVDVLADFVRIVEAVVQQPDAGDAARGHFGVGGLRPFVCKRGTRVELFESSPRAGVGPA